MKINVTLPDGSVRSYDQGATAMDVAKSISEGLARNVLSAKVNGEVRDANRPLPGDCTLALLTWNDTDGKATMWHSSAHVMAEAVEALYPGAKFGIGPAIENGFYYDIDFGDRSVGEGDFGAIEAKFKEIAAKKVVFNRREVSKADAVKYFTEKDDEYKLELIEGLKDGEITFYNQGNFTDLCRGPHIPDTSFIKAFKILNVAGAYWRGDEKRKQLTRLYAITFPKQKELDEYLVMLEEAKKRDHRKVGKELDLFTFSEKVGAGLPLWLPKGAALRERLINFMKTAQEKAGYLQVATPHIGSKQLYITSGHWEKYGKDSFQPISTPQEGEQFMLKPMNCPHHCEIFASRPRSYKDLPLRLAEFGTVYRYEQSGELHGLARVRGFTQDDAHLFCTEEQIPAEIQGCLSLVKTIFNILGMKDYRVRVGLRDKDSSKYTGSAESWDKAEAACIAAAESLGVSFSKEPGEAAFYGPKIDFVVKDVIGREWQLGTVQVDYQMGNRFDLSYIGPDNKAHRPVVIHRAPFGSMERFCGVLIEHFAGAFPTWLSPEQVRVLPISDKTLEYGRKVLAELQAVGVRATLDESNERIQAKVKVAADEKIPYMLIVGPRDAENNAVSVRARGVEKDLGAMPLAAFVKAIASEIETKSAVLGVKP